MKQKILFLVVSLFFLNSNIVYGQVPTLPEGVVFPDNIVEACSVTPPGTAFSFKKLSESPSLYSISRISIPLVGDIDNDGIVEIIVPGIYSPGTASNIIYIFKLKDNQIIHQQTLNTPYFNCNANPYSIANVDGNGYAAIFLCTDEAYNTEGDKRKLIKYVYNPNTMLYEEFKDNGNIKRGIYSTLTYKAMAQPMIVDFNGDGIAEIVTYDRVFNTKTMELLVDGDLLKYANATDATSTGFGYGGHKNNNIQTEASSIMAVGDMDNDGIPEVIGGNCVYKVNITNPNGTSGNSFTLWSKCDKAGPNGEIHNEAVDGATAIADIDGDGFLDIVVTVYPDRNVVTSGNFGAVYIWNPRTGKVMHKDQITNIPGANGNWGGPSAPFVGDIDGDGVAEVCFTGNSVMYAVKYDHANKSMAIKWSRPTTDTSAATTMSLFDFNQDEEYELVYRDITHLRIINGIDGTDRLSPILCASPTVNEYPVVADVNNDGSAEIIVTGDDKLYVYSSDPAGLWAPARKVWNQYVYNAVNINENLTVPKKQMNPATRFPGEDGVLGNSDDVRPFNGYLMQQTTLDQKGTPLWLAPNGQIVGTPTFSYNETDDKMTVAVQVKNAGDAIFQSPFYITAYKDNIGNSTKYTHTHASIIEIGETVTIQFAIPYFLRDWITYNFIILKINDSGNGLDNQAVCDNTKGQYRYYGILPTQQDICAGKVKQMTCSFTLGVTDTYQWQSSKDNSIWTNISGATAVSYTPSDQKRGVVYYRVVVDNNDSDPAKREIIPSESVYLRVRSCKLPVNHNISVMGYYD